MSKLWKKTFIKILEKKLYFLLVRVLIVPRIAQPVQQPKITLKTIFFERLSFFVCSVMEVTKRKLTNFKN